MLEFWKVNQFFIHWIISNWSWHIYISLFVYWWIHLLIFYLELLHVYSWMRLAYNFSFFWCPCQALDSRLWCPNEMNWKVLPPFIFSRRISDRLVSGAIQWWSHVGFLCVKVLIMDLISFINIEHSDFLFILLSGGVLCF